MTHHSPAERITAALRGRCVMEERYCAHCFLDEEADRPVRTCAGCEEMLCEPCYGDVHQEFPFMPDVCDWCLNLSDDSDWPSSGGLVLLLSAWVAFDAGEVDRSLVGRAAHRAVRHGSLRADSEIEAQLLEDLL